LGADDADRHIRNADIALYEAKSSGRGCARLFDQAMRSRLEDRVRLEGELRAATVNKDFHLVYQPIVQLKTGRIEFVEALIRWDHREQGVVSPSDFIPIAEETGLINEIGAWCMQTALEQFSQWKKCFPLEAPQGININIARQQLIRPRFFEQVTEVVAANHISPSQVHLEITESEMMQDLDFSVEVMRRLRQVGFKIHIDDFGTGYSSLACLNQFPVDTLKIDRSLIANITTDRYAAKLVEFVLRLAQETNVSVIAEGIELDDQARMLEKWGCQFGQGYLMARPMVGESFIPFAKSWNLQHNTGRMRPRRTIRS
jgi:EAL domain-containing protein (putative c-di-GMP-specific phosphodiesterase class I)